jgi:hypothetical protein
MKTLKFEDDAGAKKRAKALQSSLDAIAKRI